MSEEQQVVGPDLRAGVPLSELEGRAPFFGHVDGDAVLLHRTGDQVHAFSAVCTHYSGPLSEGLCTDGVIRCPWHHARFDLRTGEAVAAPALNPLPRYRTEIRDGHVYVHEKEEIDPLAPSQHEGLSRAPSVGVPASVVIVGAGAAGSAAAEMLRREGYTGSITLIDPDAPAPYDRPNLSKDYLAGNAPAEWIPLRPGDFYKAHGIDRISQPAERIDAYGRKVILEDGTEVQYGALLLATGATPIRPNIPGGDQPHVHVLRSLADCESLIEGLSSKPQVVIAGASFIGLEAAAALRARGVDVTVVAPEEIPFTKVLGPELGGLVRDVHEEHGVRFFLGRTIAAIGADDVTLSDGTRLPAQLVLLGVGVRPRLELAESAGLEVDKGVLANAFLQSSQPGIYVAGDICRYPDSSSGEAIRVEHWVVAQRQGQTAARNILGMNQPFDSVPFFWSQQYDLVINYVGHASHWDRTEIDGDPRARDCRVSYWQDDSLRAVVTIGRDKEALEAEVEMEGLGLGTATAGQ